MILAEKEEWGGGEEKWEGEKEERKGTLTVHNVLVEDLGRVDALRAECGSLVRVGAGDDGHVNEGAVFELRGDEALEEVAVDGWHERSSEFCLVDHGIELGVRNVPEALESVRCAGAAGLIDDGVVEGLVVFRIIDATVVDGRAALHDCTAEELVVAAVVRGQLVADR